MLNANNDQLNELKAALARLPQASLASLPTPLELCPRLTAELGGPNIWIKRDDLTGLAVGGNKIRMFEYVLGDAIERGVDTVVGGAAVQSNYCRQLAASCARLGLDCHLILRKLRGERDLEIQGGLLLDLMVGAKVQFIDGDQWEDQGQQIRDYAEQLRRGGRRVLVARVGDESRLGLHAVGYVAAAVEMIEQAEQHDMKMDAVWVCSSDTTQAGLALAFKHVGCGAKLVGVPALHAPVKPGWTFQECLASVANECGEILDLKTRVDPQAMISLTDYVGEDYAIATDAGLKAMRLAGRTEGLILDPVYTSKAMAGLFDHIRREKIVAGQNVVFLHTGGLPAVFAYADSLALQDLLP